MRFRNGGRRRIERTGREAESALRFELERLTNTPLVVVITAWASQAGHALDGTFVEATESLLCPVVAGAADELEKSQFAAIALVSFAIRAEPVVVQATRRRSHRTVRVLHTRRIGCRTDSFRRDGAKHTFGLRFSNAHCVIPVVHQVGLITELERHHDWNWIAAQTDEMSCNWKSL